VINILSKKVSTTAARAAQSQSPSGTLAFLLEVRALLIQHSHELFFFDSSLKLDSARVKYFLRRIT
jgi:hypothetical protein